MARASTLDPPLRDWLNGTVYPHLSHDRVFGGLPGYTKAQTSETRYADCPKCHRKGEFRMLPEHQVGHCYVCPGVIGWFAFIRFNSPSEAEAIARIAALAGVPPPETHQPVSSGTRVARQTHRARTGAAGVSEMNRVVHLRKCGIRSVPHARQSRAGSLGAVRRRA